MNYTNNFKFFLFFLIFYSVNVVFAQWNPSDENRDPETGVTKKTLLAIEKFRKIPELEDYFAEADSYAVFPRVMKAGFGIGGSRGKGEMVQNNYVIGSVSLTHFSAGIQLGGQSFSQIIFFRKKIDTNRFIQGNFEFSARASAVLIEKGVSAESTYNDGIAVFTSTNGGLMYEASIGGQKFKFKRYQIK